MYNQYRGRCIGRLLRFLWEYSKDADQLIFHGDKADPMITLYGESFANYSWDGESDIPTFTFLGRHQHVFDTFQAYKKEDIIKLDG